MSEKTWPNGSGSPHQGQIVGCNPYHVGKDMAQLKQLLTAGASRLCTLTMSEKTWPNGSASKVLRYFTKPFSLTMSEKTWPNGSADYARMIDCTEEAYHVGKDMAQLKLYPRPLRRPVDRPYHVGKDMAQLKRVGARRAVPEVPAYHVGKDMAQLKPEKVFAG